MGVEGRRPAGRKTQDSMSDTSHGVDGRGRPLRTGGGLLGILGMAFLWLAFSGKFDVLHLGYGALSIGLVVWMTRKTMKPAAPDQEAVLAHLHAYRYIGYGLWLLGQIVIANVQLAGILLSPRMNIQPTLLKFRFPVGRSVTKVALGNSITLTPGTFTLNIEGDEFIVHTIHPSLAKGLIDGDMQRRVARAFGERADFECPMESFHEFPQMEG